MKEDGYFSLGGRVLVGFAEWQLRKISGKVITILTAYDLAINTLVGG